MKWYVRVSSEREYRVSTYASIVCIDNAPKSFLASFNQYEDARAFLDAAIRNYIPDDWSLYNESKSSFDDNCVVAVFHYVSPGYEV